MADVVDNGANENEEVSKIEAEEKMLPISAAEIARDKEAISFFEVVGMLISALICTTDQLTDIFVAISLYRDNHNLYFGLTLTFVVLSSLSMTTLNCVWYIRIYKHEKGTVGPLQRLLRVICILFQLGSILRCVESLSYYLRMKCSNDKKVKASCQELMIIGDTIAGFLELIEAFMESAPELVLQLYILAIHGMPNETEQPTESGLQVASIILSLTSLARSMVVWNRKSRLMFTGKTMTPKGAFVQFLWHLFAVTSRVLALALFASAFTYLVFAFCAVHWLLMTTWILWQKKDFFRDWKPDFFLQRVMGFIHIFCFFNLNINHERLALKYVFYYALLLLEGTGLMTIWYLNCDPNVWYHLPALILFYMSFFLGLSFMVIYYLFFHKSKCSSQREDLPDGPHIFLKKRKPKKEKAVVTTHCAQDS